MQMMEKNKLELKLELKATKKKNALASIAGALQKTVTGVVKTVGKSKKR